MSDTTPSGGATTPGREQMMSALFASMVFQNTNMALMFLGRAPHPETGEQTVDIDTAKVFIDQLEMIECKTKGNLTRDEERLLQQSLTHLRLSFVEAVETGSAAPQPAPAAKPVDTPPADPRPPEPGATAAADEESRKKFSKKY